MDPEETGCETEETPPNPWGDGDHWVPLEDW